MSAQGRYNFNKVLVADVELLASSTWSPHVLALDTKINKCQKVANETHQVGAQLCSSCCLTSGNSEFRRRHSVGHNHEQQVISDTCFGEYNNSLPTILSSLL